MTSSSGPSTDLIFFNVHFEGKLDTKDDADTDKAKSSPHNNHITEVKKQKLFVFKLKPYTVFVFVW